MNKQEMIQKILENENFVSSEQWSGVYTIDANTTISDIIYEIENEMHEIKKQLKDNKTLRNDAEIELKAKSYHEIEELGEKLGLWKLEEKQKRLI